MEKEAMRERAAAVLSAWNSHDVDRVVACYTEDCIYRDPNTRGIIGRSAL
jgi:ketosteroid isomerase-like protein